MALTILLVAPVLSAADAPLRKASGPYLCRCTCFVTNTTLVPLYAPADPRNPCSTCTRQFCLQQGLEACKGAKLERPNEDTGSGWEGEVWARCLQPASSRDRMILSVYVLVVVALLVFSATRGRIASLLGVSRAESNTVVRGHRLTCGNCNTGATGPRGWSRGRLSSGDGVSMAARPSVINAARLNTGQTLLIVTLVRYTINLLCCESVHTTEPK